MKIIVCIKQIAHIYIQNGVDAHTKDMVTQGLVHIINPHDETAVEEALRLKEKFGGRVTVITLGPERAESALRWSLAMGADKAVHVVGDAQIYPDSWRTASILAGVIKTNGADLLLFGKKAMDDQMGLMGTFVAELIDLPVVTAICKIVSMDSGKIVVRRVLERGNQEEVVCPVPAVLTVDRSLNRPRYPTFPARKAAKTAPVEKIVPPEIKAGEDGSINLVRLAPPKLRPKKILSPDSTLSAAARINFVMTGGMQKKRGGTVGGAPDKLAEGIIDFLREKKGIGT